MIEKLILILFLFFLAQTHIDGQSNIGIRINSGISFIKSGSQKRGMGFSSPALAYSFSVDYFKEIKSDISVRAGLQFGRKGFSYAVKNYFKENSIEATQTMGAVSMQIIPTYHILEKTKKRKFSKFGIQGGIYSAFNFNHKWKYANQDIKSVTSSMKKLDSGFILGINFMKKKRKRRIYTCDLNYFQGIFDLSKEDEITKLRRLELGVGLIFL